MEKGHIGKGEEYLRLREGKGNMRVKERFGIVLRPEIWVRLKTPLLLVK